MIDYFIVIILFVGFLISLGFMPAWIKKAKQIGLKWKDMNKYEERFVAGSGGIIVVLSFFTSVFLLVGYSAFFRNFFGEELLKLFALLTTIIFLAGIGFIDDLMGWMEGGISKKTKILLILISAIPLVAINVGKSVVSMPFVGPIELGLFYVLVLIPMGIVGSSTIFNILAGFNGLEAGQGILILSSLSLVAFAIGSPWLSIVVLCMVLSLLGFLIYNFSPAKVFPGDSLTIAVGGLIAVTAIIGNFEKIAVFFMIPYFLEAGLKIRGKLKKQSFGKPNQDGSLGLLYGKIYSLNHLAILFMKKLGVKSTERRAVIMIWIFQIIVILVGLLIFRGGIFG